MFHFIKSSLLMVLAIVWLIVGMFVFIGLPHLLAPIIGATLSAISCVAICLFMLCAVVYFADAVA